MDDINDYGGISVAVERQSNADEAFIGGLQSLPENFKTSKNAGLLKIAALWNYWESQRDNKLCVRADDINALNIFGLTARGGPMKEDNLQKICRKAGFTFGKSLPVVEGFLPTPTTLGGN